MKTMTVAEFREAITAQGVPEDHVAVRCVMCGTIQSIADFMRAGADRERAERSIGFACVGRFMSAESPRKEPDGKPCNWTLGGLFQLHKLVVITEDGARHPRFELATPAEAVAHMTKGTKA